MLDVEISNLLEYAKLNLMLDDLDTEYAAGRLMRLLKITDFAPVEPDADFDGMASPNKLLAPLVEYALGQNLIAEADAAAFKNAVMDTLILRPSEVNDLFESTHSVNKQKAFDWLYDYCVKDGYVDLDELGKNDRWEAKELKSRIEVIINFMPQATTDKYPECALCIENEGFGSRANMRTVRTDIDGEEWFFTYSRHQYFDKHGVLTNVEHKPMSGGAETLKKLALAADFVGADGFAGTNAVIADGGAKNTAHEHFQVGFRSTPMFRSALKRRYKSAEYPYLEINTVDWYNTVIRISHSNLEKTVEFLDKLIRTWKGYSDERIENTDGKKNFCNVVCRKLSGKYVFDVILRSNALKRPRLGAEYEEIKADALGLTDVLGYFVLPTKLSEQLGQVQLYLDGTVPYDAKQLPPQTKPFAKMIERIMKEQGGTTTKLEAKLNVHDEVDAACEKILGSTAVFDDTLASLFDSLGIKAQ